MQGFQSGPHLASHRLPCAHRQVRDRLLRRPAAPWSCCVSASRWALELSALGRNTTSLGLADSTSNRAPFLQSWPPGGFESLHHLFLSLAQVRDTSSGVYAAVVAGTARRFPRRHRQLPFFSFFFFFGNGQHPLCFQHSSPPALLARDDGMTEKTTGQDRARRSAFRKCSGCVRCTCRFVHIPTGNYPGLRF